MGANFSSEPVVEKHTERAQNDSVTAAVSSCQGWRMSQEDEHSLMLELPGEHKASFFAVFDGHGSGRVSKHASEALWRHITQNESYIKGNFREALEESFLSFDREVGDSYNAQLAGTTAICVLIVDNVIYCANVGDSRAVASINCECLPLSQDHKPENPGELKRILAAGGYVLGNRVNGNLALSRAFGDFHYKSNEQLPAEQQIVCPVPDITRIELNDDVEFIVLACDGIWDVLSSEEVVNFVIARLEQNLEPGLICEQLTTRCIATDYELVIGCDNMTVLLVCHTRGRSWEDYCTDVFERHTKKLGVPRTRTFDYNFDNTFQQQQHDDRFLRSGSSGTEQSRDTSLDRTFAANETSTDSDNTSAGNRSSEFGARDPFDILSLFEVLKGPAMRAGTRAEDSDEQPPITEVVAEEQAITPADTTETYGPEGHRTGGVETREDAKEASRESDHQPDMSADMSIQESVATNGGAVDDIKSSVTEIHLASPDDDSDDGNEIEEKEEGEGEKEEIEKMPSEIEPDQAEQSSGSGNPNTAEEALDQAAQNTIEIQLECQDQEVAEQAGGAAGVSEQEVEAQTTGNQVAEDELPEVVEDSTGAAGPEAEAEQSSSQDADETGTGASDDNGEGP